jgi:hypothetical protein
MDSCDVMINNSFDLTFEENMELKQYLWINKKPVMVRNFATTAALLCTSWAQTPQELVNEIRYQAAVPIKPGLNFQLTDENGTHLEGKTLSAYNPNRPWLTDYSLRREEYSQFRPWPEYMHPPIRFENVRGMFVFEAMLSWWSRYIGISPYFNKAIRLTIENSRITRIEGAEEAEALSRFLASLKERLGEGAYDFNCLHFGINPQASVAPHQCPNPIVRRLIDHSHSSNIHAHIGVPEATESYPYWVHVTGDIRHATFKVGDTLIHDRGHLTALDHPSVKAIAAKYPGRPGLEPVSRSY